MDAFGTARDAWNAALNAYHEAICAEDAPEPAIGVAFEGNISLTGR